MQNINITKELYTPGTQLLKQEENGAVLSLSAAGAGLYLPQLLTCRERYLVFRLEAREKHSIAMHLLIYGDDKERPAMTVRFGILPEVDTLICIDLEWLDGHVLFPEALPGELKVVCHGRRISRNGISRAVLASLPAFHDLTMRVSDMAFTDEYPASVPLPDGKLADSLGQNKRKEWDGKTKNIDELKIALQKEIEEQTEREKQQEGYPFEDWSAYGGWIKKKLGEGTGYFTKQKADGRWWLADPLGHAYFSVGPDCVGLGADCRVDGIEKWLDWLPEKNDAQYGGMFRGPYKNTDGDVRHRQALMFSYAEANLYRVFGESWYEDWKKLMAGQLKRYGMNTLGNWSDPALFGTVGIPYVTSLPEFPSTKQAIFRDFPDVFSAEYETAAIRCAQALEQKKQDPFMIGYFLRNEPSWAFVDNLVLADEVLFNPERTVCKDNLIGFLKERYTRIENLNREWNRDFSGFDDLYEAQKDASKWSEASGRDMREFSRRMLRAYVEIPSKACRKVDPNHMILGMRWAWISDPDLVTGWENFDVFSINCYAVDPTPAIQNVVKLGVDLPVIIGEFHFGALDAGPTATGLEGVASQMDRGIAYRYYCERVAAHPNGVGCHYFQCYDQFALGRFDGENYNIGLFDICSRPYQDMLEQVRKCSRTVYRVADGRTAPVEQKAHSIPMIAY